MFRIWGKGILYIEYNGGIQSFEITLDSAKENCEFHFRIFSAFVRVIKIFRYELKIHPFRAG